MKALRNIIIISLIILIGWFFNSPYMEVGNIVLLGDDKIYGDKLFDPILKKNWLFTSEDQFLELLLKNKLIEEAKVYKSGFLELSIDIKWREPFVAIHSGGNYVVVDHEGVVLKVSDTPDAPYTISGFTVVSSKVGSYVESKNSGLIDSAVKFVYLFREYSKINTKTAISPNIELVNGQLIQRINDKLCINFGTGYNPEEQFTNAMSIYADMNSKKINSGVINLSNVNQNIYEPWKDQF